MKLKIFVIFNNSTLSFFGDAVLAVMYLWIRLFFTFARDSVKYLRQRVVFNTHQV